MVRQTDFVLSRRLFLGVSLAGAVASRAFGQGFSDALAEHDALALGAMVNRGAMSASDLVTAAIKRIERLDPQLNAIAAEGFEQALSRAAAYVPDGAPFAGVPYLLKDLIEYPGLPFQSGSRMFRGNVSDWRSDYVAQTELAGLIVLGKTTTPEFGLLPSTEPQLTGVTRNPWNLVLSPGGSSGGACAAVAAGMVPFAHASDGGGSIRIPASLCGLFGFKPSRGRQSASRRTQMPADISVDHCVSWSVRDSARLLSLTERAGPDAIGFVRGPQSRRLRIGCIMENYYGARPDAEVEQAVSRTARLCRELDHQVDEAAWSFDGEEFADHFMTVWGAGAAGVAQLYARRMGRPADKTVLEPWTLAMAEEFNRKGEAQLHLALAYFDRLTREAEGWHDRYDVFLSPVTRRATLNVGAFAPTRDPQALRAAVIDFASYTPVHNVIGAPAMSVPLGRTASGSPIGSQFAAKVGDDATLLSLAYELEAAAPWRANRPAIAR